jgi:polar amino acid transport system permease protein
VDDIATILHDYGMLLLVGQYPTGALGGLALTIILAVLGLALAFPLSVLLALARVSPFRIVYWPATALVYVMRGLPLIMLIFWVYFFLPALLGRPVSGFSTLLATLVLYEAAYLAEIVRAGIESLPRGQMEAARSVGLTYMQAMRKIILPQAIYNMVPAMLSQFVSTIKETSLGYVISVNELTFAANQVNSTLLTKPFPVFVVLASIYFVLCFSLTQLARQLEKRVARRRAGLAGTAAAPVALPEIAAIAE